MYVNPDFIQREISAFADGDKSALPYLYYSFSGEDSEQALLSAQILADGLQREGTVEFVRQMDRLYEYTSLEWYSDWTHLAPSKWKSVLPPNGYFAMLAAGSFHPNGYYREACLRELVLWGSSALPFLLLRVNDWVHPIRELALTASCQLLQICTPAEVLAALPFLYQLEQQNRRSQTAYAQLEELTEERLKGGGESILPAGVQQLDRNGRRFYYRLALRCSLYQPEQWRELLIEEKDPYTRRLAAQAILNGSLREELLPVLLSHRDGSIRQMALQSVFDLLGPEGIDFQAYLCDSKHGIRELARYAVKKQQPEFDFSSYYCSHLLEPDLVGALLGLGEVGKKEDAEIIRPFLTADRARVQKAALGALGYLCGSAEQVTYYQCLLSGGGRSKLAFHLLINSHGFLDGETLYRDLMIAEDAVVQRRLCTLLFRTSPWEGLPYALQLWTEPDEELHEQVWCYLSHWSAWYQRVHPAQWEKANQALGAVRDQLPSELVKRLDFEFAHRR